MWPHGFAGLSLRTTIFEIRCKTCSLSARLVFPSRGQVPAIHPSSTKTLAHGTRWIAIFSPSQKQLSECGLQTRKNLGKLRNLSRLHGRWSMISYVRITLGTPSTRPQLTRRIVPSTSLTPKKLVLCFVPSELTSSAVPTDTNWWLPRTLRG